MRLDLIRHAEPDYARDDLTSAGRLEAQALAQRYAASPPTHLYVSSLGRARATAQHLARATGLVPVEDPLLDELDWHVEDATWGRLSAWDLPGERVRAAPSQGVPPAFGAGVAALHAHGDALLARHGMRRDGARYAITRRSDEHIAVVGHGGVTLTWLPHLLDLPVDRFWCGFWLPPSSVTTLVFEEHSDAWATPRCTALADVSHLVAAGLPTSPSGRHGRGHAGPEPA